MSDLAVARAASYPRIRSTINRVLDSVDESAKAAILGALDMPAEELDARTLSARFQEHGWPISDQMITRWRKGMGR